MTQDKYWENVALVQQKAPNSVLLPTLKAGYSKVNIIYLNSILKKITALPKAAPPPPEDEYTVTLTWGADADETLRGLWAQRTQLFGEMNKLSNHFHDCKTDDQRLANSKAIMRIWAKIEDAKTNIRHYEQHKCLPEPVDEIDTLPDNPVQLSKRLASLRSRISQKKQQIVAIAALDEGTDGKQAKIDNAEQELKHLRYLCGLAEQKLKSYEHSEAS